MTAPNCSSKSQDIPRIGGGVSGYTLAPHDPRVASKIIWVPSNLASGSAKPSGSQGPGARSVYPWKQSENADAGVQQSTFGRTPPPAVKSPWFGMTGVNCGWTDFA